MSNSREPHENRSRRGEEAVSPVNASRFVTPAAAGHATFKSKDAWRVIPRTLPPKRPAIERVRDFEEIDDLLDEQSVREQASRCLQCPEPMCRNGCPLANRIPEWLALAAEGKFLEASALSNSTSNMPEICSRVCPQERLCEGGCVLSARSVPVAIGAVEKFVNEYAFRHGAMQVSRVPRNGWRVAVVGSGPAGMACADELAKLGYAVSVFDAQSVPGGLLVHGIPAFKLDKRVVERRLNLLRGRGVTFRMGVMIGRDISLRELIRGFHAVFLAFGAQQPKPLDIPGAELAGVFDALPFLISNNPGAVPAHPRIEVAGKRVIVLGGGDTAMDCLRTAIRCGAREAICLYRRDLANMPGSRKEYLNAAEEGARVEFLINPIALEGDASGRVTHVRCQRMELGPADAGGRSKPRPIPGSEFTVPADVVLSAFGFDPVSCPPWNDLSKIAVNEWGGAIVDANQMTNLPGVFAGGDLTRGPSLVVHAVRDGRKAALGIDQYLSTQRRARSIQAGPGPLLQLTP